MGQPLFDDPDLNFFYGGSVLPDGRLVGALTLDGVFGVFRSVTRRNGDADPGHG